MSKAKTDDLDALRSLIAERQQFQQWISTLQSKRDGTPPHVFERVQSDYQSRLDRVVTAIRGQAEHLQQNITTLSSRLTEVVRDEEGRRDTLQEAELRAAVGEYDQTTWETMRTDAQRELDVIAAEHQKLDAELDELRSIQAQSESTGPALASAESRADVSPAATRSAAAPEASDLPSGAPAGGEKTAQGDSRFADSSSSPASSAQLDSSALPGAADISDSAASGIESEPEPSDRGIAAQSKSSSARGSSSAVAKDQGRLPLEPNGPAASPISRSRAKTPASGAGAGRGSKATDSRAEQSKTLKCPECGSANYPTEWYCERCGGELATM